MNFCIQLTISLARDRDRSSLPRSPTADSYLARHISGDSKEAIDPEQFGESSKVVQRTENLCNLKISSQSPK